ncbi:MAG TPA: hypothetical protein VFO39_09765 [Candidatus Sulfotelmatobacter sp.]|nr:hypothetical protein [Candidatus Sulfotelmatobacter sp.]
MLREALLAALFVPIVTVVLPAQRMGAASGAHAAGAAHASSMGQHAQGGRSIVSRGTSNSAFANGRRHRRPQGGVVWPYYDPFWSDYDNGEAASEPPAQEPPRQVQERAPERPLPKSQIIEIPGAATASAAKALPPTIFVLTNGERVETQHFLLTAHELSLSVDRNQRTIPLQMLDVNATLAANRDRGIDLRIPSDRNEISLRF